MAKGFKDAALLKSDDERKLLRDHVEFKKLLAERESKPATTPEPKPQPPKK